MIRVTPTFVLDPDALEWQFIRAGGPGGQNVNKVATAVQLRFDAAGCAQLPAALRARLKALAGQRMTAAGVIVIRAQRFRTQERNREDALARLLTLLRAAAHAPRVRKPTAPPRSADRRRLDAKRRLSVAKQSRARFDWHE